MTLHLLVIALDISKNKVNLNIAAINIKLDIYTMKSNQHSNLFLDQTKDPIWFVDHNLYLVYANKAYLGLMKQITGKEKELNTIVFVEGFSDEEHEKWTTYYQRALSGEKFEVEENFYNPQTKEIEYGQVAFTPLSDDNDDITQVACRSTDITPIIRKKDHASRLMNASLDVFCTINKDGKFVYVNEVAKDHWGYRPEELVGKNFRDLILEEDLEKTNQIADEIIAGRKSRSFYNRFRKKNGDIAYNLWSSRWDNESKLIYCVARDSKENLEQKRLLLRNEERFRALVQDGFDLIAILDSNGIFTYASPTSFTILGIYPEELLGINAFELVHYEDVEKTFQSFQSTPIGTTVKLEPFRYQNKQKEWRWIEASLTNMLDNPAVNGIVANCWDITEKIEEAHRLKLFKKVVDSTSDAIIITDAKPLDEPGPIIQYVNEAFTKITGYSRDEIIGQNPRILQGDGSNYDELNLLGEKLRKEESAELTVLNYTKTGEPFWNNFVVSPVTDENDDVTNFISVQRDVTDKKNKEFEQKLLAQISSCFREEKELPQAGEELCNVIKKTGNFDLVELWCPNLEHTKMTRLAFQSSLDEFNTDNNSQDQFLIDEGLPGKVWQQKERLFWDEEKIYQFFKRKLEAENSGLKNILGIPLKHKNQITGILVIGSTKDAEDLVRFSRITQKLETFIGSEINRKRLEDDLKRLYKTIPDILCIADFEGRFLKMNPSGCDLLGYSEEEIIYHSFKKFMHPDDLEKSMNLLKQLGKGVSSVQLEIRLITKDRRVIWTSWNHHVSLQEGLIYASVKDITKEKKLLDLNRQAHTLANIGIWELDVERESLFWSEMVHQLHETDAETFIPDLATAINFYRKDFRPMVAEAVENAIATGSSFDFEAMIVTKHQNERWIRCIGKADQVNGKTRIVQGSFQDIHKSKTLELELERSNEELEQFAFITSHDLQEPLRMVSSFMDQLKRKYADELDEKALQYIFYATDGAQRMKQIIQDLLLYSRANRPTEQREEINFNEIVFEYTQLRRKLIADKKAEIIFDGLPVIETYKAPATQIIHSLLDNALKYGKEHVPPVIQIHAKENGDVFEFAIKDNGIGIDKEFYEKIFVIFQRLHHRKHYEGTGIGLSIVKRSVEFLGGEIWLESTPGEGSTFYFTIPKTN